MNDSDRTVLRNILNKAYISPLIIDSLVKTISANGFKRENLEGPSSLEEDWLDFTKEFAYGLSDSDAYLAFSEGWKMGRSG